MTFAVVIAILQSQQDQAPRQLFGFPPGIFWPYFVCILFFVLGLIRLLFFKRALSEAKGLDKFIVFGPLLFAVPLATFGSEHFTALPIVAGLIPAWIPFHVFFALLVGTCLILAALAIIFEVCDGLAAFLVGLMLTIFILIMHIPNIRAGVTNTEQIRLAVALRDLAFSGGAFALASVKWNKWRDGLAVVARLFLSIPLIVFGIIHFLRTNVAPGVPLAHNLPAWTPLGPVSTIATGVIFIVGGALLLVRFRARLTATIVGIWAIFLLFFMYLPIVLADPRDIGNGLNYFADTMMLAGALFLLANATPRNAGAA
jgi:uncharacterized membrane protein